MKLKQPNNIKGQKVFWAINISLISMLVFSGIGIGIGYAIWHRKQDKPTPPPIPPLPPPFNPGPIDCVYDGPEWDLDAFNEFYTWDYAAPIGTRLDDQNYKLSIQYNVASYFTDTVHYNWFSSFRHETNNSFMRIERSVIDFPLEEEISYQGGVRSDFSYDYAKTVEAHIDGSTSDYERNTPCPPVTFIQVTDNPKASNRLTEHIHIQYIKFSTSIWFPTIFNIWNNLLTVSHLDNRLNKVIPTDTISHNYNFRINPISDIPAGTSIDFKIDGKAFDLISQGVDGGIANGLKVNIQTVDGTSITQGYTYDPNTQVLSLVNTNNMVLGRQYIFSLSWDHTVAPF